MLWPLVMKKPAKYIFAVIFLLNSALLGTSRAVDVLDIKINEDYTNADQYKPRVAVSKSGVFAVAWTDKRNGQIDIYFQLLDSTGQALSGNKKLIDSPSGIPEFDPGIDANYSSQFVSAWRDYRNGNYPYNPDIYFARIDTTGTPENINLTAAYSDETYESPDIAMFSDGSSIIVWPDYRNGNWDIYGRRVGPDGELPGNDFKINDDIGINQQHSPRSAAFWKGGFVVVWQDNRLGNNDIYFQRFDSAANPIGSNAKVNDDAEDSYQAFPVIAADGVGRFFIAWVDWRNGNYPENPDIYLRRYDSSGIPLASSEKINSDETGSPQREVSIAADRAGNLCVVWADSSYGQWDAVAQIIDNSGQKAGGSFIIHDSITGKQVQPDVAADGYKYYFVWSDYRSGNFDVYAAIKHYNDPTLIVDPGILEFSMEKGGPVPEPGEIALLHAGIGEAGWEAVATVGWLSVSPASGLTPDTLTVFINTDTLPYGTYYGEVVLINTDANDSTGAITVKLTVTAPLIDITPDTLYFKVLAELGNPESRKFRINNSGSGYLDWIASETADWFAIDKAFGTQGDYITVDVDISGLVYDNYFQPLVILSNEAVNSPETAWVHLELVGNMPYIDARPDSLVFSGIVGESLSKEIEIVNLGAGTLDWTAVKDDDWFDINIENGSDYDTVAVTVESAAMATGYYCSEIRIYDSSSFNIEVIVPVQLYLSSGDTIEFINGSAPPGGPGVVPISAFFRDSVKGAYIPFTFDSTTATLDSIIPNSGIFPSFINFNVVKETGGKGEIGFRVDPSCINDSSVAGGQYVLANLFFTASDTNCHNLIDTLSSDSSGVYVLNISQARVVPAVISGSLVIGTPTGIEMEENINIPGGVIVGQNYPNPFNTTTSIRLSLSEASHVSVVIYNILGQEVRELYNGYMVSGTHLLIWDGKLKNSIPAPTGVYFYRVVSGEFTQVRKMLLLK